MTRGKKMTGLCLVFAGFCLAAYFAAKYNPDNQDAIEQETFTAYTTEMDTITKIDWTYNGETLSFEKTDGNWRYSEDESFPVDTSYIQTMLEDISNVPSTKVIEEPESLSEYGLEDGECVIHVTSGDTLTEFVIGDQTAIDQQRYLSIGDGKVYLISSNLLADFSYGLYDIVEMEVIPSIESVQTISITTGTQDIRMQYIETESDSESETEAETTTPIEWLCTVNGEETSLDANLADDIDTAISTLSPDSCVDYNAGTERLQELGFGEDEVTITVSDSDDSYSIVLSNDCSYMHLADSTMVYSITTELGDFIASFH